MDTKYNDYTRLFALVKHTIAQQNQQKLRGFNDYNMVNIVRKASEEVGMHSNILYSLLDPHGLHYQNDLFLNLFIEKVLSIPNFGTNIQVFVEYRTDKDRRIDFVIKSDLHYIGIEMKVNANDQKNQVYDYYKYLKKESQTDNNQQVTIYYLTKFGKEPSDYSTNKRNMPKKNLKIISFKDHILEWINICQKEVIDIANLNLAFENYKDIVKKISKQYKGNVMTILDELFKQNNHPHLKTALELGSQMDAIKGKTLHSFFEQLDEKLIARGTPILEDELSKNTAQYMASLNRCTRWFSGKKLSKNIGRFYRIHGMPQDLYLLIQVATNNLHYGVVKLIQNSSGYEIQDITANEKSIIENRYSTLDDRNWKNFKRWYSRDLGDIRCLDRRAISLLMDLQDPDDQKKSIISLIDKDLNLLS